MKFKKYIRFFAAFVIVLFICAYALPAILISDGSDEFSGAKKEYAKSSINELEIALSSPSFYKIYITKFKVIELDQPSNPACKYTAVIQGYTYFGISLDNAKWQVSECGVMPYNSP